MIESIFLGIFSIILIILLIMILRNKIIFKLGIRNLMRRKIYTMIVIFGLMIGTGVISSSLVIGDTMDNMIETEVLKNYYTTDEIIVGLKPTGTTDYFNYSIFTQINNEINKEYIDGISPSILDRVAVLNLDTNLSEPIVILKGVDFDYTDNFGSFYDLDNKKITNLNDNELMIGENTADDFDAEVGHKLILYVANTPYNFTIKHILQAKERAGGGIGLYVTLNTAQELLDKPDEINRIIISNNGGVYEGMEYSNNVKVAFEILEISDTLDFEMSQVKSEILEDNIESMSQFTDMFIIFGTFSIIAGIILIINIFVMLAEERKSEMGMARAIGMKREHLKKMYFFEGSVYAISASFIGVFFGIFVGYIIIYALEEIFRSFGDVAILEYFNFTTSSLVIGFIAGFIITLLTIVVTSNRISKLNIIRAIRSIPEPNIPRSDIRLTVIGILLLLFGVLLYLMGNATEQITSYISGISLVVFGLGLLSRRFLSDRIAFTMIGLIIFIIWALPADYYPDYSASFEIFIISGLFMVFSVLIIIMFNSEVIVNGLTLLIGRGKSRQAVIRTAVSYSLNSKFRTGMTIAIFALVIFTITTMSMIIGMFGTNIEGQVEKASGGYEIIAYSSINSPIQDIEEELRQAGIYNKLEKIAAPYSGRISLGGGSHFGFSSFYMIIGIDDDFIVENEFEFSKIQEGYDSNLDVWNAIKNNSDYVIVDASVLGSDFGPSFGSFTADIGETIELKDKDNKVVEKTIIGILDTVMIQGIFSYKDVVADEFGIDTSTYFMFSVNEGEDIDEVAKNIESSFLKNGMQAIAIQTMILEGIKAMNQFFNLFIAFMGLGLVIGIAGLGIITIRSVHERRQEIGMMRAIGFKREMILSSFIIETSIVAILGILIGTFLGIFTGYMIWRDEFKALDFEFVINWQPIIIVFIIAFVFTLLCIFPASRKASKIPPAEALRYKG
jgi:putative ABC transport system permease protein